MAGPDSRSPGGAPTDAEIVARVRGGDREAFGVLVRRHQGRVYRLAVRVLRDEDQALDVVQEGFLKAYRSLDRFEGRSSFYTWLYRLVLNLCIDTRRRNRPERRLEFDEERHAGPVRGGSGTAAPAETPVRARARAEIRELLDKAIETLPEDARRTLELREVDGLDYAEIARCLDIPKGTVMSRLHYARKRLRASLEEAGVLAAEDVL